MLTHAYAQETTFYEGLQNQADSQKITAGALHLCPALTEPIEEAGGVDKRNDKNY